MTSRTMTSHRPDPQQVEIDGNLWRPVSGATTTADQLVAALALLGAVHRDARWSPWVREDRAAEYEAAWAVRNQWTRAEPGFRPMTDAEFEAESAKWEEDFKNGLAAKERDRLARIPEYDHARHDARLALLEEESLLEHHIRARDEASASGSARAGVVAELEKEIAASTPRVAALRSQVPDPEAVIDARGRLPRERRELMLIFFSDHRVARVRELREKVTRLTADLDAVSDRDQRATLRAKRDHDRATLDALLAVPPLQASEMCADCARPNAWHLWSVSGSMLLLGAWPCLSWPRTAARRARAWEILNGASRRPTADVPAKSAKEEPLAVVRSGLPLGDIIEQLIQIRARHPDAIVRRGNRNRWEIWPAKPRGAATPKPEDHGARHEHS